MKEGEELKRIEAGFGKSTAGNVRLLDRALKLADRAARRGIAAAEDQGDTFTANEIRSSLEFKFDEPAETTEESEIKVDVGSELPEGATIFNKATNQRMRVVNGQLVEI